MFLSDLSILRAAATCLAIVTLGVASDMAEALVFELARTPAALVPVELVPAELGSELPTAVESVRMATTITFLYPACMRRD